MPMAHPGYLKLFAAVHRQVSICSILYSLFPILTPRVYNVVYYKLSLIWRLFKFENYSMLKKCFYFCKYSNMATTEDAELDSIGNKTCGSIGCPLFTSILKN